MIFSLLTLISALSLAGVAGWFSIIGIMSIYAGASTHALIMGVVLEAGKLVTTSWLYRNWAYSDWRLKAPLIFFTITLMLATSIGVFGFLSKSHLEQGSSTIDNAGKIERLQQQIAREKSTIADNDKVIGQLDATVNSYIGKDRTDKSVTVRRNQESQRQHLRTDSDAAQKRIDQYGDEKLALESEVRKLQLDVGPIRYIAELIYGATENTDKNIESAVRIFTLIIVSTLDPLAIILLIAANHTIMRQQMQKKESNETTKKSGKEVEQVKDPLSHIQHPEIIPAAPDSHGSTTAEATETPSGEEVYRDSMAAEEVTWPQIIPQKEIYDFIPGKDLSIPSIIRSPSVARVQTPAVPHFTPLKVNEEEKPVISEKIVEDNAITKADSSSVVEIYTTKRDAQPKILQEQVKYPRALGWLDIFKRT